MPLQSIGYCPWCSARVDMKKEDGAFRCPVCDCRYRHNWITWIVGIPVATGVAILFFQKLHSGIFAALAGAIVAFLIVSHMSLYKLLEKGRSDVTVQAVQNHKPEKKESRWAIIFMIILLASIAAIFFLDMKWKR